MFFGGTVAHKSKQMREKTQNILSCFLRLQFSCWSRRFRTFLAAFGTEWKRESQLISEDGGKCQLSKNRRWMKCGGLMMLRNENIYDAFLTDKSRELTRMAAAFRLLHSISIDWNLPTTHPWCFTHQWPGHSMSSNRRSHTNSISLFIYLWMFFWVRVALVTSPWHIKSIRNHFQSE